MATGGNCGKGMQGVLFLYVCTRRFRMYMDVYWKCGDHGDHGDHLNLTHQQKRRPGGRGTYAQPGEHQTRRLEICEPVGKQTYVHN